MLVGSQWNQGAESSSDLICKRPRRELFSVAPVAMSSTHDPQSQFAQIHQRNSPLSMSTFIIPGGVSHLARINGYLNDDICGILVHEKIDARSVRLTAIDAGGLAGKIYTLSSLVELTVDRPEEHDIALYQRCLARILSDQRVHYLARRSYLNSAFNNSIVIEKILVNSIRIIRRTKASRLVATSTPHSVEAWIFAKCFEYMDLPVYILERTPINDRAWIYRGLDTQEVVCQGTEDKTSELTESSLKLIREQRGAKPGARDENGFYVSRMDLSSVRDANSNRWWSYKRELRLLRAGRIISLPLRVLSIYLKRVLYRSYQEVSVRDLPDGPFVIYFMHYQPERSSLPEGLSYVQQWTALRLLSWALPEGWTLLVREHPTTWLLPLDISARTASLYKEISSLRNTKVCSMDIDTFELIDKCKAAATLTGSVGFQAILRNKPVIAFGLPAYKDHAACLSATSFSDLVNAFNSIQEGELRDHFSDDAIRRYLAWIEHNSLCADPEETNWLEARLKNFTEIYRRLLRGELVLP